jgi:bud site selection protein 20
MAGPQRRKKVHKAIKDLSKKCRTRRRCQDLDQIQNALTLPQVSNVSVELPQDLDLPGLGQFPCPPCAKYFANVHALTKHLQGKIHKKRVKLLRQVPYTLEEAEAAAGMGNALVSERNPRLQDPPVDSVAYRVA